VRIHFRRVRGDAGGMNSANTRSVAGDHHALREMASGLQHLLGGSACTCGATRCTKCLGERMRSLASRLRSHFDAEEESWRGIDRHRCDWTTLSWIDRLVGEHDCLRERLDATCSLLEEARRQKVAVSEDLAAEIRSLLADLIEHELGESRLFQRSVFEGWGRYD
jgi:hypothetical protein